MPPRNTKSPASPPTPGFTPDHIRHVLERVARGDLPIDSAMSALRDLPFEDLGFATLDHHRCLRKRFPEVIFCSGKTPAQVAAIARRFAETSDRVLGTRASPDHYRAARKAVRAIQYDPLARVLWLDRSTTPKAAGIVIVAAGTSDLPVAEEAARTAEVLGHTPQRIYDVGVAGLHRLLHHTPALRAARVVIVVAGMEGALPSVVGGLIAAPVIAVPTSVGYGSSFGGLAALLGMLNSCAPGLAVVNIDNGFGAGYLAANINAQCLEHAALPTPAHNGSPKPHRNKRA